MSEPISALYIVDSDYEDSKEAYRDCARQAQEYWDKYIELSHTIINGEKDIEGSRARAYIDFIEVADELIRQKLAEIIAECVDTMGSYISEIDEADSFLY